MRESNPEMFEIFGTGGVQPESRKYSRPMWSRVDRWFSISVYSTERDYFVAVFQDITERKRMEQEMIVMNNQLSHEVAMRTADLSALTAHIHKIAETEKSNLARELHDELGSTLVALKLEVERQGGEAPSPELAEAFSRIKEIVIHALQTTRSVVNQLYPTVLDDCGLVAAIQWQAKEFRTHSGIAIELDVPKEPVVVERTYALAAYRITQECLTNIAKHAEADKIHIEVASSNGFLDSDHTRQRQGAAGQDQDRRPRDFRDGRTGALSGRLDGDRKRAGKGNDCPPALAHGSPQTERQEEGAGGRRSY